MTRHSHEYLTDLVRELVRLPNETPWVEYKHNNYKPQEIGEYISALSNSAALEGKPNAYLLWGIENGTHAILGTKFKPREIKKGNEPLENWLSRLLEPNVYFHFYEVVVDNCQIVILKIAPATSRPILFDGVKYIRIGEVKKPLRRAPELERELWRTFDATTFEKLIAAEKQSADDVLRLLDYPAYFDLLDRPLPTDKGGILETFARDRLIRKCQAGGWDITNLGALLFAKDLNQFPKLQRKAMRIIQYPGDRRVDAEKEKIETRGYACGFKELIGYINDIIPTNEVIGQALRKSVPMFPELAVRELVANALIHQDLRITGSAPMVEIFNNRIEITNPGKPLVETDRFVDAAPESRNESMAAMMRRARICEERGSGIDKVLFEIEYYQLPAPLFEIAQNSTRTVLFSHKNLNDMDKHERIRACYLHACLRHVCRQKMTNTSLRERFNIEKQNAAKVSRLLTEAMHAKVIIAADARSGNRNRSYVPYWA